MPPVFGGIRPRPRPTRAHAARARRPGAGRRRGLAGRDPAVPRGARRGATPDGSTSPRPTRVPCSSTSARCSPSTSRSSLAGRRTDQVLLPAVGLLGGLGLLLMQRLPQDLVTPVVRRHGRSRSRQLQLVWLAARAHDRHRARARGPLRRLAAHVQVHVGRDRASRCCCSCSCSAREVNGARLTLSVGPLQRAAVGAAEGDPRRVPRRLPVREPGAARRARPRDRAVPAAAGPVPRADGRDVGDRAADRRRPARPRRGAAVLRRVPRAAVRRDRPLELRASAAWSCSSSGARVLYKLFGHVQTRVDIWLDPFADPLGAGLPGHPGAVRVRPRRACIGTGLGGGLPTSAAACRSPRSTPTSRSRRWARSWA